MSNTEQYEYEAGLKRHVEQINGETLRKRLQDFVDVAPVDVVRLLGTALGFKLSP